MKTRKIFFNEEAHAYTDEFGNKYTSTTTLIHKYYEGFKAAEIAVACERIGRNPNHPKYLKYKGKSAKQLIKEWEITSIKACNRGSDKHDYLETAVKTSTQYKLVEGRFINDRIYTLDDVLENEWIGRLNLDHFRERGVDKRFPIIFSLISDLVKNGWKIYAEVGVYDPDYLISGLIDLPLIKENKLLIIDWKTNEAPIKFEAGYFEKDNTGKRTDKFIYKDECFYHPIDYIPASTGHKYSMQLSGYGHMAELFGLKHIGSILCHITESKDKFEQISEHVDIIKTVDLKNEFKMIKEHHFATNHKEQILEKTLFNA